MHQRRLGCQIYNHKRWLWKERGRGALHDPFQGLSQRRKRSNERVWGVQGPRRGRHARGQSSARGSCCGAAFHSPPRALACCSHCRMISSNACLCSRSRRLSSSAMWRFQRGKSAARRPDDMPNAAPAPQGGRSAPTLRTAGCSVLQGASQQKPASGTSPLHTGHP